MWQENILLLKMKMKRRVLVAQILMAQVNKAVGVVLVSTWGLYCSIGKAPCDREMASYSP